MGQRAGYQAFVTNTSTGQLASSKPVTGRTRESRTASGTPRTPAWAGSPPGEFGINTAWLALTMIAADLVAWTRLLALTGDVHSLATCETKALRYRLLHVPARIIHGQRRHRSKIPETWPRATAIVAVFANIAASRGQPDSTRPPTTSAPAEPQTGSASRHDVMPRHRHRTTSPSTAVIRFPLKDRG